MAEELGRPFVIENKAGAGGVIATDATAKAAPDGYTLLLTTPNHTINAAIHPKLPYDSEKDLVPIAIVAEVPELLVGHPAAPFDSFKAFVEYAKKNPGKLNYASAGNGTLPHVSMELLLRGLGITVAHIPYRGAAPAMTDLVGGQLDALFGDGPTVIAQIRAGKIRPIAATSHQRSEIFPDVPTFLEQGFADTVADQWAGVLAPAGVPEAIVGRLNAAIAAVMSEADVRARLAQTGVVPGVDTPAEFAAYLTDEFTRWGRIIREKEIKAE
jgi:tripartite-type tricarboxylate transporter receptor subunit TctC